jgi:transcriptional regulator with XRE-family HTH domain
MNDEITYGEIFRTMRKNRGISLAVACENVTTPSFLSKFERGENDITMKKFPLLLKNIDATWTDFMNASASSGHVLRSSIHYLIRVIETGEKEEFLNLKELHEKTAKTDDRLDLIIQIGEWKLFGQKEKSSELKKNLVTYFSNTKFWDEADMKLLVLTQTLLTNKQLASFVTGILKRQDKSLDNNAAAFDGQTKRNYIEFHQKFAILLIQRKQFLIAKRFLLHLNEYVNSDYLRQRTINELLLAILSQDANKKDKLFTGMKLVHEPNIDLYYELEKIRG